MAVVEVVAHALLATPAAALVLDVEGLRRPQRLRVGSLRFGRDQRWVLVEAGVEVRRLHLGLAAPADGAAVHVMHVRHLGSAVDDALLHRVAKVTAHDWRGRVAERVAAVGDGLVDLPRRGLLEGEAVHEGLAAVVEGAAVRAVRLHERIDLGDEVPGLVEQLIGLVADLVVEEGELAERTSGGRRDHCVPPAVDLASARRRQVTRTGRLHDQRAEEAVGRLLPVVAVAVEVVGALGLVLVDHPLVRHVAAGEHDRFGVGGDGRPPGARDHERRGVQVDAGRLRLQFVGEVDAQALALVDAEQEGLDGVALEPDRDRWLRPLRPRPRVGLLLLPHPSQILGEHVHAALGVVVEVAIQGDVDVDGDHVVAPFRRVFRARAPGGDGVGGSLRHQAEALRRLVGGAVGGIGLGVRGGGGARNGGRGRRPGDDESARHQEEDEPRPDRAATRMRGREVSGHLRYSVDSPVSIDRCLWPV